MLARRTVACFFVIIFLYFLTIMRMTVLTSKDYSSVLSEQNYTRLKISRQRGTIYDCNKIPITNNKKVNYVCVMPCESSIKKIEEILDGEEKEKTLKTLKEGKAVLLQLDKKYECDGFFYANAYTTTGNTAIHTIGYTDSNFSAVSGIEKAYDSILNLNCTAEFVIECDAKGRPLENSVPEFVNTADTFGTGIVTTIDSEIQEIIEKYEDTIEKGAIIVTECKTGKIRALASFPTFDLNDSATLKNLENSPFLNRTINSYNVGSVFKPCVAAAAIESGNIDFCYFCSGSCQIAERQFKCHEQAGHKFTDLYSGIANSCNTYFYNLALNTDKDRLYNMIKNLKFGNSLMLCEGIYTSSGYIPKKASLSNNGSLANLSIGQGELLLSPISLSNLYTAIANGGLYYNPSLIEGTLNKGNYESFTNNYPTRCMQKSTAETLKNALRETFVNGTAESFRPNLVTAAGKTATAQTGKFQNNVEICSSWFCGFFPFEEPLYTVIVFSEDSKLQTKATAQIFSEIADAVTQLKS